MYVLINALINGLLLVILHIIFLCNNINEYPIKVHIIVSSMLFLSGFLFFIIFNLDYNFYGCVMINYMPECIGYL